MLYKRKIIDLLFLAFRVIIICRKTQRNAYEKVFNCFIMLFIHGIAGYGVRRSKGEQQFVKPKHFFAHFVAIDQFV